MGKAEFNTNDGQLIQVIQDAVQTRTIEVAPGDFLTRPVYEPPQPTLASSLVIHTLRGVIDYLKADPKLDRLYSTDRSVAPPPGEIATTGFAVHVLSETEVNVLGALFGRFRQREVFLKASSHKVLGNQFQFGSFYPLEVFNIYLRSFFILNDDIENILRLTGNITQEDQEQWTDDGVSQSVIAKTGIAKREDVTVPPSYSLQPFRTFRDPEIQQPASDFFLRLKKGNPPQAALFETDGGAWRLRAIQSIKNFLSEELADLDIPIIA